MAQEVLGFSNNLQCSQRHQRETDGKGQMGGQVTPCHQIISLPNTSSKVGQQPATRAAQHPRKAD